jgi:uncharacterized LabA/DUF88 family protein
VNRTAFIVDGFNLYHSAIAASKCLGGASTKWLDIRSLCESYLSGIGDDAQIQAIYYFSAPAQHLTAVNPGVVQRHMRFIKCLRSTGVKDELHRFRKKDIKFRIKGDMGDLFRGFLRRHEEKETDVAIASKLFELLIRDECDTVLLVTGDTDFVPACKTARRLFPDKNVGFLFPFKRSKDELADLASLSFSIDAERYAAHQFPDPVTLPSGTKLNKPSSW